MNTVKGFGQGVQQERIEFWPLFWRGFWIAFVLTVGVPWLIGRLK